MCLAGRNHVYERFQESIILAGAFETAMYLTTWRVTSGAGPGAAGAVAGHRRRSWPRVAHGRQHLQRHRGRPGRAHR